MKVVTMNTDYAIRALLALATRRDVYMSAREIAELQDIPYQYLRRILQSLIRNGLIESKEGSRGGVRLIKDASKIRIIDVMRTFQGNVEVSDCLVRGEICSNRGTCVLRREVKRIEKLLNDEFAKITILSLLRQPNRSSARSGISAHGNRPLQRGSKKPPRTGGTSAHGNRSLQRGSKRTSARSAKGAQPRRRKKQ